MVLVFGLGHHWLFGRYVGRTWRETFWHVSVTKLTVLVYLCGELWWEEALLDIGSDDSVFVLIEIKVTAKVKHQSLARLSSGRSLAGSRLVWPPAA